MKIEQRGVVSLRVKGNKAKALTQEKRSTAMDLNNILQVVDVAAAKTNKKKINSKITTKETKKEKQAKSACKFKFERGWFSTSFFLFRNYMEFEEKTKEYVLVSDIV